MSNRFFASLSAALGWSAAALAVYGAHWDTVPLALAIFNAAYWFIAAVAAAREAAKQAVSKDGVTPERSRA